MIARILDLPTDKNGWILPLEDNIQPEETRWPGVFLAGAASGPKDIPETVAQASGAAGKVLSLFARWDRAQESEGQLQTSPEAERLVYA